MTPLWGNPEILLDFNSQLFNANIRHPEDLFKYNTKMHSKGFGTKKSTSRITY